MASVSQSDGGLFVGRQRELSVLHSAWLETQAGHGRLVLITGEPGIGKTRTAAEFAEQAGRDGACVLWGGCYAGEWAPPFGPFAEAIATYARQCDADILRDDLGFGAAGIERPCSPHARALTLAWAEPTRPSSVWPG